MAVYELNLCRATARDGTLSAKGEPTRNMFFWCKLRKSLFTSSMTSVDEVLNEGLTANRPEGKSEV